MIPNDINTDKTAASDEQSTESAEESQSDSLNFDYKSLQYIQLRGNDSKIPAKVWGGYDQDFDKADNIHDHEDISIHPAESWGIVGIDKMNRASESLLIFDLDLYKLPEDFDEERIGLPSNTLVTRSQRGGYHIYFRLLGVAPGDLSESDFEIAEDLPADIRGSAVSAHVVAPADIPGCSGSYEVVKNEPIASLFNAKEACADKNAVLLDGEPAIQYNPGRSAASNFDWDVPEEPPESMPKCYHAGLELRKAAPDDHPNSHMVNVLTGLCGLAAGYSVEEIAAEMCGEYAPVDSDVDLSDKSTTEYQLNHLKNKLESGEYSPPSLQTLRSHGILGDEQSCGDNCEIENHDPRTQSEKDAAETIRSFIEKYAPIPDRKRKNKKPEEWPTGPEKIEVREAIPKLADGDFSLIIDPLASRIPQSKSKIETHRELTQIYWDAGSNVVNHKKKLTYINLDGYAKAVTLLNFEFNVEKLLSVEGGDLLASVEAIPSEKSENSFTTQIEPKVFNDSRRFKDEILSQRFSTTIEAKMHESDVMDFLRKYISRQDVPKLTGQTSMGLADSGDEFVTPNGVIGKDGWMDESKTVYVEQNSGAEVEFKANPADHSSIDPEEIAEMLELFTRTRDPERFLPVLGWMYAAPLKPWIVDTTGSFNLLHINGDSGVGKTHTLIVAQRLFGMSGKPFSASDTKFAHIKSFSSSRSIPIWLDEYKNSELAEWKQNALHELLRKAATGGIEKRGTPNDSENIYHLRAPVIISGETTIRGTAEQRRAIDVSFTNPPTTPGSDEYNRYKKLVGNAVTDDDGNVEFPDIDYNLKNHATAYYSYITRLSDDTIEDMWHRAREYVSKLLAEWETDLGDLEIQGLQTVRFGYDLLRDFAEEMGANLSLLPSEEDLDDAIRYIADVDGAGRESNIDQFLDLVQRATVAGYLEDGTHWKLVREGKGDEELRININRSFDEISRYIRDHDLREDLLGSSKDYKDRFAEKVDQEESYVACTSQNTHPINRCTGIHTGKAIESLESFERELFTKSPSEHADAGIVDEDEDVEDIDAKPIKALNPNRGTGYVSVTVEVKNWEEIEESDYIAAIGSVADESGAIKIVDRHGCAPDDIDVGKKYKIDNIEVSEYKGKTQLKIDKGPTEFTEIEAGVGHLPYESPDDQQESVTKPSQDEKFHKIKSEISKHILNGSGAHIDTVVDSAAERLAIDEDEVRRLLTKLKKEGQAYEPQDGRIRLTGGE